MTRGSTTWRCESHRFIRKGLAPEPAKLRSFYFTPCNVLLRLRQRHQLTCVGSRAFTFILHLQLVARRLRQRHKRGRHEGRSAGRGWLGGLGGKGRGRPMR